MEWHTTGVREELLVILAGRVVLELQPSSSRRRVVSLGEGQCAFLPQATMHRVVNRSTHPARYLYVTA